MNALTCSGTSASSIVYLARDTLLRRQVAIKEISASGDEKSRVLEEARVLDRLRHPTIVRVNSVDTIGSKVIIDMEYVEERDLQTASSAKPMGQRCRSTKRCTSPCRSLRRFGVRPFASDRAPRY